jgi:hypothetical protein
MMRRVLRAPGRLALLGGLLAAVSCAPPPSTIEPVPDCTTGIEADLSAASRLLGSLACTWPLIADDRSSGSSNDLSLTHGLTYEVVIDEAGVTIPADTGVLAFAVEGAAFETNDTVATVTLVSGDDQAIVTWTIADETIEIIYANTVQRSNYRLSAEEPPSPLLATGAYSDLSKLATTYRGRIDLASAFETNAEGELIDATPTQTTCDDFVMVLLPSGVVDIEVGDDTVNYPYRPRQTSISQVNGGGVERTQMTWFEPDGRRLALEATRAEGSDDDFVFVQISVQVAEGPATIAEYTTTPATSTCGG